MEIYSLIGAYHRRAVTDHQLITDVDQRDRSLKIKRTVMKKR